MKTKTFERDGEQIIVSTGFDKDGEAAIIVTHTRPGGSSLMSTKSIVTFNDSIQIDTAYDFLTEDNIWDWPNVTGLWG